MARPKSMDKRNALMAAATRVIVTQGLSAPTAMIAQEAGVANGSLFTYFETKADLFNQLYLELETEMASVAMQGLAVEAGLREQLFQVWSNWMGWAVSSPEKRRALALLNVSEEITPESRTAAHKTKAGIADLLERIRINSPMRDTPMGFVLAMMSSLADATIDFIIANPTQVETYRQVGFEALWRIIG